MRQDRSTGRHPARVDARAPRLPATGLPALPAGLATLLLATTALGQPVRYEAVSFDAYRKFGFPGADDLGNMFQYKHDFEREFRAARPVEEARKLYPGLQTFRQWLARYAKQIPLS